MSVVSGFFDGGLGHDSLSPALVAFQVLLLTVTGVVGVLAAARATDVMPDGAPERPVRLTSRRAQRPSTGLLLRITPSGSRSRLISRSRASRASS